MSRGERLECRIVGETLAGLLRLGQAEQTRRHRIDSIGRQQLRHLPCLSGIVRSDDQLGAAQVAARETPDARFGEFYRIAGGIAEIERASTALPFKLGLDNDALCREAVAPSVDLLSTCRKAHVAGPASAVGRR